MTIKNVLALSVAAITLVACGGGGGGGGGNSGGSVVPTVTISSGNAERVTAAAMNGVQVDDTAGIGNDLLGGNGAALALSASAAKRAAASAQGSPRRAVALASETFTEPCDLAGGTIRITANDADNDDDISAGDTIQGTLTNCFLADVDATANGSVSMRVTSVSGEPFAIGFSIGLATTYSNLSIDGSADDDVVVNGSTNITLSVPSATTSRIVVSGGSIRAQTNDDTTTMTNPNLTFTFDESTNRYSISGSNTVTSQELGGTVSFVIDTPLVGTGEADPDGGSMTITGANSRMLATANNNGTVRLQIDETNDGTFDAERIVTWDEIVI